jgi:hypothetical protein
VDGSYTSGSIFEHVEFTHGGSNVRAVIDLQSGAQLFISNCSVSQSSIGISATGGLSIHETSFVSMGSPIIAKSTTYVDTPDEPYKIFIKKCSFIDTKSGIDIEVESTDVVLEENTISGYSVICSSGSVTIIDNTMDSVNLPYCTTSANKLLMETNVLKQLSYDAVSTFIAFIIISNTLFRLLLVLFLETIYLKTFHSVKQLL